MPYILSDNPPIGIYELEKSSNLFTFANNKAFIHSAAAFGSEGERFRRRKPVSAPGPAEYNLDSGKIKNPKKFAIIVERVLTGEHLPGFGSQKNRFDEKIEEIPSPVAYNIIESYHSVKDRGQSNLPGVLSSHARRELFKIETNNPGPALYLPKPERKKEIRRNSIGAFLSTGIRFGKDEVNTPGVGSYSVETKDLIKKSFNQTYD